MGNIVSLNERLTKAVSDERVSVNGIFSSLPMIVFLYMYTPNIPAIYHELTDKSMKKMSIVLFVGTTLATIIYLLVGFFGYATFIKNDGLKKLMEEDQNILMGPYHLPIMKVCQFGILVIVLFASPFSILPSKDSLEELLLPEMVKFTNK